MSNEVPDGGAGQLQPAPAPEPVAKPPALTTEHALAEMEWLRVMRVTGSALFESGLFGLKNIAQGLVVCIKARDLEVTPTYILDRFWPVTIPGRGTTLMPKSNAVVAKFRERKGLIELKTDPLDRTTCTVKVTAPEMAGKPTVEVTYTIEDAKKENPQAFVSGGIWTTRPAFKLYLEACKTGIRIVDPQTFIEVGESDDELPEMVESAGPANLQAVRAELVANVTPAAQPPPAEPKKGRGKAKKEDKPAEKPMPDPEKKAAPPTDEKEAGAVGGRLKF